MAVGERSRRELQEALMDAIGPEPTDTLLTYLPPTGWADVATTRDLQALGAELRGELHREIGSVRGEIGGLRGEIGGLRGEIGGLRGEIGELRGEITGVRGEITGLRAEMNTLAATLRGDMHHELRVQFYSLAALMAGLLALAVAASSHGLFG